MNAVLLHTNHAFTWTAWHPEPSLVVGLMLCGAWYAFSLSRLSARSRRTVPQWKPLAFAAGVFLVFVALGSPLDVGAGKLFSLHMLQHVLLTTWAPPLLLLGLPADVIRLYLRSDVVLKVVTFLTQPLLGASIFIANMWFWHFPAIYQLAVEFELIHYSMHLSFLGSGLMFWWSIIRPVPELHPVSTAWRFFYVFFTGFPMMVLALILIATPSVLYDYYAEQPRVWGISVIADQQLGGAIMGSLGELTMLIPFTVLFVRMMNEGDEAEEITSSTVGGA